MVRADEFMADNRKGWKFFFKKFMDFLAFCQPLKINFSLSISAMKAVPRAGVLVSGRIAVVRRRGGRKKPASGPLR
jgi:hypothetical protein